MKTYTFYFPTPHGSPDRLELESIGTIQASNGRQQELLRVAHGWIDNSATGIHDCPIDFFTERLQIVRETGSLTISQEDYRKLMHKYGLRHYAIESD